MDISEILSMLISLAVIFFAFIRPIWLVMQQRKRSSIQTPSDRGKEQELEEIEEEKRPLPILERSKQHKQEDLGKEKHGYVHEQQVIGSTPKLFTTPKRKTHSSRKTTPPAIDAYTIKEEFKRSRGNALMRRMKSKKEIFILQAIIGPPKGK